MLYEKIKNNKIFIAMFLILFVVYGIFIQVHFSVDSYVVYYRWETWVWLANGRYLSYLLNYMFEKMQFNMVSNQRYLMLVFIGTIAWAIQKLYRITLANMYNKSEKTSSIPDDLQSALILIAYGIVFVNVFIVEWFTFPETTLYYAICIIFAILAVERMLDEVNVKNTLWAAVFIFAALASYQIGMLIGAAFTLIGICIQNNLKLSKKAVYQSIWVILITTVTSGIWILSQKVLMKIGLIASTTRTASFEWSKLQDRFQNIISANLQMWKNAYGFLPTGFMPLCAVILCAAIVVCIHKRQDKWNITLYIVMGLLAIQCITLGLNLMVDVPSFYPRTLVPFFTSFTFLLLVVLYLADKQWIMQLAVITGSVLLLFNIYKVQMVGMEQVEKNALDQQYAGLIQQQIEDYEQQTGIQVTTIALGMDEHPTRSYPQLQNNHMGINNSALYVSWGGVFTINYYTEENYIIGEMDANVYQQYFAGKDWKYFDGEEQVVIVESTAYVMLY